MSNLQPRVNKIMKESTTPYLLTEDVVEKLRSKYSRDYSRVKVKDLTRLVTKAVSAYRTAAVAVATAHTNTSEDQSEEEASAHDTSTPKFNLLNAGMRRRYTSTKTDSTKAATPSSGTSNNTTGTGTTGTTGTGTNGITAATAPATTIMAMRPRAAAGQLCGPASSTR